MPRVCAVSHERMMLVTDGYMCISFLAFQPCRVKVTLGIFPMSCSVMPLTAFGLYLNELDCQGIHRGHGQMRVPQHRCPLPSLARHRHGLGHIVRWLGC